jgi:hypothetical protein
MKRILKEFELSRIAAVDRPCQQGAVVTILKRDYSDDKRQGRTISNARRLATVEYLVKQFMAFPMMLGNDDDGPDDFDRAFKEQAESQLKMNLGQELYPYTQSLSNVISGIVSCSDLGPADKKAKIRESVEQFMYSLQNDLPNIAGALDESVTKRRIIDLRTDLFLLKIMKVVGDDVKDTIDDFISSDAPQFEGKSKAKRIQMALAAHYS